LIQSKPVNNDDLRTKISELDVTLAEQKLKISGLQSFKEDAELSLKTA